MSLRFSESIETLALGQALLVAPALGETYAGKTAQTVAALLVMLAADARTLPDRRLRTCARLADLFRDAEVHDISLARDLDALIDTPQTPLADRHERMLAGFTLLHAWADAHDAALARRCREVLAEWAEAERLLPPTHPEG
ncbi:MAG: hypothetical protein ACK4MX_09440 [Thermaurantiacus sp.]